MDVISDAPRVLVAAPQHESKNYCWEEWADRVKNLTYPNYEVFLADNSPDKSNMKMIQQYGFDSQWSPKHKNGLIARINEGHEACRKKAISGKFDYMLHLETDVIPPYDVIERLMNHKREVCSGLYDIFYGERRKLMVQIAEKTDRSIRDFRTTQFLLEEEVDFFNGGVQQVYHAGIGCALIRRDILEKIPFRVTKGNHAHSDTWFAHDLFQHKIPMYVDTTVQCKHLNFTWLEVIDEII